MRDLSKLVDDYYANYYQSVHKNLESRSRFSFHKKIESLYDPNQIYSLILELGAGQTQHWKFLRHKFDSYLVTDIRGILNEDFIEIEVGEIPKAKGYYKSFADATDLKYPDESFSRIITGCLLLHINDPLIAVDEWIRVLKPGGRIDALIPNDHSLSLWMYRLLVSRKKARKLGFYEFDLVNALEHFTYYDRVVKLINARYDSENHSFQHSPPVLGQIKILRAFSILRMHKSD